MATTAFFSHTVIWELVNVITASPKMLVFKPGQQTHSILIRSEDRKPFRVERVECQASGIRGRAVSPAAAGTQVIEIEGSPHAGDARGTVTVFTDHPAQRRVDVSYIVLN